jgi:hypothetical protein
MSNTITEVAFEDDVGTYGYISVKSNIDPTMPEEGNATTQSVRENFAYSKYEIEALQAAVQQLGGDFLTFDRDYVSTLPSGDTMLGPLSIIPDPTMPRHAVTKDYVDNLSMNGGGGLTDAPSDGLIYGRKDASWVEVQASATTTVKWENITDLPVPIEGLAGDPTNNIPSLLLGGSY